MATKQLKLEEIVLKSRQVEVVGAKHFSFRCDQTDRRR